ncbi:MAG: hypothetical protein KDB53_02865 [Planctomycetes bacterium]|nr:hypothetical protein [Planctomycetota bacterium]
MMQKLIPLLFLGALVGCASSPSDKGAILIDGDLRHSRQWTAAMIESELASDIRIVNHATRDGAVSLRAIPLSSLVRLAEPRIDDSKKNHALAFAVVVSATDGYSAVFTYDEVVPFRDAPDYVYLAFAEAGGPLPPKYAPARLVLESAKGDARKMYAVDHIRVVDLADSRSAAQP